MDEEGVLAQLLILLPFGWAEPVGELTTKFWNILFDF